MAYYIVWHGRSLISQVQKQFLQFERWTAIRFIREVDEKISFIIWRFLILRLGLRGTHTEVVTARDGYLGFWRQNRKFLPMAMFESTMKAIFRTVIVGYIMRRNWRKKLKFRVAFLPCFSTIIYKTESFMIEIKFREPQLGNIFLIIR